jgi:hypothetical protein
MLPAWKRSRRHWTGWWQHWSQQRSHASDTD